MTLPLTRRQVLGFRVRAQQLDRAAGTLEDTAVLDIGVQDTGPDGGRWALALRGVDPAAIPADALAVAWTIRGAPHLYRRRDLPDVAAATAPFSDADAGKRIVDAAKPLKAAGIGNLEALDTIAAALRSLVTAPMVKGDVSGRLNELLPRPFLRECRPCNAIHVHEQSFRLAALRAGLELEEGTSPPVLRPVPGLAPREAPDPRFDVVRGYLRLFGPATARHVAEFLDAPPKDVTAHWPADAVEVAINGEKRWVLADDADRLAGDPSAATRLLGPYDLFLQARDRSLVVTDAARAKDRWRGLGRPSGVLSDGEIVVTCRAPKTGSAVSVTVEPWTSVDPAVRTAIGEQAERLAAFRGLRLGELAFD